MTEDVPADRLAIAALLLPGADLAAARMAYGAFHDVVLFPGSAAVRIARRPAAAQALSRRTDLAKRLGELELPFQVPVPLTAVTEINGHSAVAMSWIGGSEHGQDQGDPARFAELLDSLSQIDVEPLSDVLGQPHEFAGGPRWEEILRTQAIPLLPERWQAEARRRVEEAMSLPDVEPRLVHGDLAGSNLRWNADGSLLGVMDWDLASPFDPAYDAACLAWHGWENLRAAVTDDVFQRARVWQAVFGIEQLSAAILNDEPPEVMNLYVEQTVRFLEKDPGSS